MAKLSPAYREDQLQKPPLDVREYLDEHFLKDLPNITKPNPKLLVVFAGGTGIGKSTLSQKIAKEFNALVLSNDAIKRQLLAFDPSISSANLNVLTWRYGMDLYRRLGEITPNGLVVRDGVIQWYYDKILPVFQRQGYELFIVGYDLSEQKQRELILGRGDTKTTTAGRLLSILEDQQIHLHRFRLHYTPDVMLTDDTIFDHERVIAALHERLRKSQTVPRQ